MDRGSETGIMATMHAFLRRHHDDVDPLETIIYGSSTSNQVSFKLEVYTLVYSITAKPLPLLFPTNVATLTENKREDKPMRSRYSC